MLTQDSSKFWAPIADVVNWVGDQANGNVLEIGPGLVPFAKATTFVDFDERKKYNGRFVKLDLSKESLPFDDNEFDFVYCRHVLEDMFNPFLLCGEMARVAKAGYVETPSPIAEFTRGIDGGSPKYRGYHHHRYLVWNDNGVLSFAAKLPIIEYVNNINEIQLDRLLAHPAFWNSYLLWDDAIKVKHYQCPLDFDITTQLPQLLADAMSKSEQSTRDFWSRIKG